MALEMKVYREIRAYEAKVMWSFSWRQLLALAVMITLGGGLFAAVSYALYLHGQSLHDATSNGMWVMFPVLIPAAFWGWARPKGLKPEQFFGYWLRHNLSRKVINYVDTYGPELSEQQHESVDSAGAAPVGNPGRAGRRAAEKAQRRARKFVPREHS